MADEPLRTIQDLVRRDDWLPSPRHLMPAIVNGEYDERDIVASILSGEIVKNQRDEQRTAVDGRKYTIVGDDRAGLAFATVGKIIATAEGKRYFLITAYQWR